MTAFNQDLLLDAEAFRPDATVDDIVETVLTMAKEGTRAALEAVVACARSYHDWRAAIEPLRHVMRSFDGAPEHFHDRGKGTDDWTPSRMRSIEELPTALGFLVVTAGDFEQSIFGGANYGRDCDSIASMAGAIAGTLHGARAIRPVWITRINDANRIDLSNLAIELATLSPTLQQRDLAAARRRDELFTQLGTPLVSTGDAGV